MTSKYFLFEIKNEFTSSFPLRCFWNQLMFTTYRYQNIGTRSEYIRKYINRERERERETSTWAEGGGRLRIPPEREATVQSRARIVNDNESTPFALYPYECISFSKFSSSHFRVRRIVQGTKRVDLLCSLRARLFSGKTHVRHFLIP